MAQGFLVAFLDLNDGQENDIVSRSTIAIVMNGPCGLRLHLRSSLAGLAGNKDREGGSDGTQLLQRA